MILIAGRLEALAAASGSGDAAPTATPGSASSDPPPPTGDIESLPPFSAFRLERGLESFPRLVHLTPGPGVYFSTVHKTCRKQLHEPPHNPSPSLDP